MGARPVPEELKPQPLKVEAEYSERADLIVLRPDCVHWKGTTLSGAAIDMTPEAAMMLRDKLTEILDYRSVQADVFVTVSETLSAPEPLPVIAEKIAGLYQKGSGV